MQKIENDFLIVTAKPNGAELCSIYNKQTGLEYLWQAGHEWPKHAPILFPIVGQLKDNIYIYEGKKFSMDRHGFARTMTFLTTDHRTSAVEYSLIYNEQTLAVFPFQFELLINYEVIDADLKILYSVINHGEDDMYFSVGAHPAFKVPLVDGESYDDYYLEFNKEETTERWMLNNGLLDNHTKPVFNNSRQLLLSKSLFNEDAIIFKDLHSDIISLKSKKSAHGFHFQFKEYPYFGIWAAKDADFICLEPWMGIADNISTNQQLSEKEGIITLLPGEEFTCDYAITLF